MEESRITDRPLAVTNSQKLTSTALIFLLIAAAAFYISAITPDSFGFYHDDSIYVATAKSLATGQGYRIISLPGEPTQTKSPPLHPFLLSLIWRVNPNFPANLWAMMLLSALAAAISLALIWRYLTAQAYASRLQALLIVALTALNWRTVILSSGIYSEMFYLAVSVAGLHLAEEYEKKQTRWATGTALGVILGLAFLARTSGITLLVAVAFYYLLRRQFKRALMPLATGASIALAWIGWGYFNRPTGGGVNASYYESYIKSYSEIIRDAQAQTGQSGFTILLSIIGKNLLTLLIASVPLICLGLPFDFAPRFGENLFTVILIALGVTLFLILAGLLRHIKAGFRLLHIYVILYFGLHLIWPYSGQDRFLMPLLPFLLLFLVTELERVAQLIRKGFKSSGLSYKAAALLMTAPLIALISFAAYNYGSGLYASLIPFKAKYAARAAEDTEAIQWIKEHTDPSDVLVCYRDPMYYLYTGRKATRSSPLIEGGNMVASQRSLEERAEVIFRIIQENGARYLVLTSSDLELESQADAYQKTYNMLLDRNSQVFVPVFKSTDGRCVIYRVHDS